MLDIQRFATDGGETTSTGAWYQTDEQTARWVYVPAGITFESYEERIQRADGETMTYAIDGANSATGDSQTVTITLSGDLSGVTVSDTGTTEARYTLSLGGGDKTALKVIVGGTTYSVNAEGKLYIPEPAGEMLSVSVVNTTKRGDNKLISKTINYINPNAADSDIAICMAALNGLSKNSTVKGGLVVVEKRSIG